MVNQYVLGRFFQPDSGLKPIIFCLTYDSNKNLVLRRNTNEEALSENVELERKEDSLFLKNIPFAHYLLILLVLYLHHFISSDFGKAIPDILFSFNLNRITRSHDNAILEIEQNVEDYLDSMVKTTLLFAFSSSVLELSNNVDNATSSFFLSIANLLSCCKALETSECSLDRKDTSGHFAESVREIIIEVMSDLEKEKLDALYGSFNGMTDSFCRPIEAAQKVQVSKKQKAKKNGLCSKYQRKHYGFIGLFDKSQDKLNGAHHIADFLLHSYFSNRFSSY